MKCLSLFSGIGGFDLALQNLGHEIIGACEIDKYAQQIYKRHFPTVTIHNDATTLQPQSLPQFDLLCGGFPCQAFSVAGKRRGFDDCRGTLFFEIARIAKEKRPRYLLLENVRGLLSHNNGDTFRTILETLDEMGYDAEWQIINSKYFVPQNRERIFIIGHLRGERTRQIFPLGEYGSEINLQKLKQVGTYNKPFMRRKNEPDKLQVIQYLKDNRSIPISDISDKTGIIKTQVEHYFRLDKSGALPDRDDWLKLKNVMQFDNTWDEIMTEYVEDKSTFEITSRVYDTNGISPTLEATGEGKTIMYEIKSDSQSDRVYNKDGLSPALGVGHAMNAPHIKVVGKVNDSQSGIVYGVNGIACNLNANGGGMGAKTGLYAVDKKTMCYLSNTNANMVKRVQDRDTTWTLTNNSNDFGLVSNSRIRRLTPLECERLQGFPDNWTEGISDTQRYKCIGNAVTVPVIEYIVGALDK